MPVRDLKTKPFEIVAGPEFDLENPAKNQLELVFPDNRPVCGRGLFFAAGFLSLLFHLLIFLLFWAPWGRKEIFPVSTLMCDTQVSSNGPEVDCIITLPDARLELQKPSPYIPKNPLENVAPLPPIIDPDVKPTGYSTPPLVPAFSKQLSQEKTANNSASDSAGEGHSRGKETGGSAISFFQIPSRGQTVVYVIDRSASMGLNGGLALAKRELRTSVERLPSSTRFQVIAYNRFTEPFRIGGQISLLSANWENKSRVLRIIEDLQAEGGTDHLAALKRALIYQPEDIFFLTDADDLTDTQIQNVTNLNRGRTAIHCIECKSYKGTVNTPLQILAEKNHGVFQAVDLHR
ncbi:MAG TPA: VWA domain-containing protein [Gemmataceae bacterium]|nr:VWA domain-containing protein [Gemmataceae bacterium]